MKKIDKRGFRKSVVRRGVGLAQKRAVLQKSSESPETIEKHRIHLMVNGKRYALEVGNGPD